MTPLTQPLPGRRLRRPRRGHGDVEPVRGGELGGRARPSAARRAGTRLTRVAESRLLGRLISRRLWIPLLAALLIGIVLIQVFTLGINAAISRAVEQTTAIERQNAALASEVSRLESSERLGAEVAQMGMVDPIAGSQRYVTATGGTAVAAARELAAVAAGKVSPEAMAAAAQAVATASAATPSAQTRQVTPDGAPAATAPAATGTPVPVTPEETQTASSTPTSTSTSTSTPTPTAADAAAATPAATATATPAPTTATATPTGATAAQQQAPVPTAAVTP